jgi:D-alanyl-D-alanine carboxypeptidase
MIFFRRCLFTLCCVLTPALTAAGVKKPPTRPVDDSTAFKGAIVMDAATGNVLFEDRADFINAPASMVKLMTFAVLHDRLASGEIALSTNVKITNEDSKIGGTQVFLDPRETFPIEELIYAMMIQSANDASHALARAAAGSVEGFVELMNLKAKSLGLTNTSFRTPHGLPPASRKTSEGDLTTPRDYAILCRYLLQTTDVLKYASIRDRPFGTARTHGPLKMENHNKLLGKVSGVDGLKTGFTDSAGYCISATAARNGRRVIVVIMGSLGPNGQRDYGRARDIKAIELIERGFTALPPGPSAPRAPAKASTTPILDIVAKPTPLIMPPPTPPPAAEPMIKFSVPKTK